MSKSWVDGWLGRRAEGFPSMVYVDDFNKFRRLLVRKIKAKEKETGIDFEEVLKIIRGE